MLNRLDILVSHFYTLSYSEFRKQILIICTGVFFVVGSLIWYVHSRSSDLVLDIISLNKISTEADGLVVQFEKIKAEEERINKMLEENKSFNIKTFFERMTQDQRLTVEGNWETETMPVQGNDSFEELRLPITVKGQSIEGIVKLLGALEHEPMVEIKETNIRHDGGALTISLLLATKKHITKIE